MGCASAITASDRFPRWLIFRDGSVICWYPRMWRYSGLPRPCNLRLQQKGCGFLSDDQRLPRSCCLERRHHLHFVHAFRFHCSRSRGPRNGAALPAALCDSRVLGVSCVSLTHPRKCADMHGAHRRYGSGLLPSLRQPGHIHVPNCGLRLGMAQCLPDCCRSRMLKGTLVDARGASRSERTADLTQNRRSIPGMPSLSPSPPPGLSPPPSRYPRRPH